MIYADPSFLTSLYTWDANTQTAQATYSSDKRRPLFFTPWQRFECRNAVRLAAHKLKRGRHPLLFSVGNVLKRMDEDLSRGILRHEEPGWRETMRIAEDLSEQQTETLGLAAVDVWHVAAGILLGADTFWTFDVDQRKLAEEVGRFKHVPRLPTA